jgi:C1A family cysteine protease
VSTYGLVAGARRHLSGCQRDARDPRDFRWPPAAAVLPAAVDLRRWCPPVFDQGEIGSCTANASCAALAFLERRGPDDRLFSRLFVYYYTRQVEGTPPADDAGAQIRTVMKVLARTGVPYEQTWPYDPPHERYAARPSEDARAEAERHKVLFYYRCSTLATVRASLAQGFPVVFGFSMPENMTSDECRQYGRVRYPEPGEKLLGGHAVLAVGFDDTVVHGDGTGALLVRNSWGSEWGMDGYFWLPYRFFSLADRSDPDSALATDCWTIRRAAL